MRRVSCFFSSDAVGTHRQGGIPSYSKTCNMTNNRKKNSEAPIILERFRISPQLEHYNCTQNSAQVMPKSCISRI